VFGVIECNLLIILNPEMDESRKGEKTRNKKDTICQADPQV